MGTEKTNGIPGFSNEPPGLSMFSWFGYFQTAPERFRIIRDAGFDGVMLAWEDEEEPVRITKEHQTELARMEGLRVVNAHAPFIGWNDIWRKNPAENTDFLRKMKEWIRGCGRENIPAFVVHTSDMDLGTGYSVENGIAFFSELAEEAQRSGVRLAVENVSRQYLLRAVLDRLDVPSVGMCYDSSHDYMLPCGRGRILKDYGSRIAAVHLSDNDLYYDRHWIPGEGRIPFEEIGPGLCRSPLNEISLEVCARKDDPRSPEAFCGQAFEAARRLSEIYRNAALYCEPDTH